jgi:uncharacterized repeat protein (TIGR01451 family)
MFRTFRSRRRQLTLSLVVLATAALAGAAIAANPGVDPQAVSNTVNPGDSFNVAKTVHTPVIPPNPDVVFLADTTGSMGATLANVKANASAIMGTVAAAPGVGTPEFAVAQYKDFNIPDGCSPSSAFPFNIDQGITATTGDVQTAINTWSAGGGCDTPEAQINALWELAQPGAGVFRAPGTSSRIIVWFGDSSGHDPSGGHTIGDAISALQAANARVIAVPVSTGGDGLDNTGQATQITSAPPTGAGGVLLSSTDPDDVSDAILTGLQNLPVTVSHTETCDPDLTVSLSPTSSETVISGSDVTYDETVSVAATNPGGVTLHCTVQFFLNGVSGGPDFAQSVDVTVNGADLAVTKSGPAFAQSGGTITYTITARNNGPANATGVTVNDPLPAGETLVSAVPSQGSCAGSVTCSLGSIASGGSATVTVTANVTAACGATLINTATIRGDQFDPDTTNNASRTSALVYCLVPGGNFVIGDGNDATGTSVTFWGAQWSKLNDLSGGKAPSAFKGWENSPAVVTCGTDWTTKPGNSPPPPAAPLPSVIAVIVSSSIDKSGSTISGDTAHLVVVRTNPGYAPNPGHAGTGTVLGQIC